MDTVHSIGTGDRGQHITNNNNNNNIIRIITKELGEKKTRRKRKNKAGNGLSSAASCGGFSDRERKKEDIHIYLYMYIYIRKVGSDGLGLLSPHCQASPPSPELRATLYDALSDQVPIEVIRDLLIGTRRWNCWPRDHMVSWAVVSC